MALKVCLGSRPLPPPHAAEHLSGPVVTAVVKYLESKKSTIDRRRLQQASAAKNAESIVNPHDSRVRSLEGRICVKIEDLRGSFKYVPLLAYCTFTHILKRIFKSLFRTFTVRHFVSSAHKLDLWPV